MRVIPNSGAGQSVPAGKVTSGGAGQSFEISAEPEAARAPKGTVATIGLTAVLALQSDEETPQQRRRRQLSRGFTILEALDAMKIELLSGGVRMHTLERISAALALIPASDLDPQAQALIREVEVRAAVELAKYGR